MGENGNPKAVDEEGPPCAPSAKKDSEEGTPAAAPDGEGSEKKRAGAVCLSIFWYFAAFGVASSMVSVFNHQIETRLELPNESLTGWIGTSSLLASVLAGMFASSAIERYGGLRPLLVASVLGVGGQFLTAVGFLMRSYAATVAGSAMGGAGLGFAVVYSYTIVEHCGREHYRVLRMLMSASCSFGMLLDRYAFPSVSPETGLFVAAGANAVGTAALIWAECLAESIGAMPSKGKPVAESCEERGRNETVAQEEGDSEGWWEKMKQLPIIFWLIFGEYTVVNAIEGYISFSPYALQHLYGLSVVEANNIVGMYSIISLVVAIPTSLIIKRHPWLLRSTKFVFPVCLILGCLPLFMEVDEGLLWYEYTLLGAAKGVSPTSISGDMARQIRFVGADDALVCFSFSVFMLCNLMAPVAYQSYFLVFANTEHWRDLTITPGQLFNVALGGIMLLLSSLAFRRMEKIGRNSSRQT